MFLNMAMCLNCMFDSAPGRGCKSSVFTLPAANPCLVNVKSDPQFSRVHVSGCDFCHLVLIPSKPSAIDCLPEV